MASRSTEEILPLYSIFVRVLPVEYCIQLWGAQHKTGRDVLQRVQDKNDQRLEHISCEERLRELGLFSLEKRKRGEGGGGLWGDLVVAFQYLQGAYKKDRERLISRVCSDRTRGNSFKLKEGRLRLDVRKTCFTMCVVSYWNRLLREVVDASSVEVFKLRLDGALSNLIY